MHIIKRFSIVIGIVLLTFYSNSKAQKENNLKFNKEGKFKIVQFTDIHMKIEHESKRDSVLENMRNILAAEKPDLVVLTGDIVTSEFVKEAWKVITSPMADTKIPWAVVFGNHDFEHGYTNKELMDYIVTLPSNLSQHGPEDVSGVGNYVLEITGSQSNKTEALLYFIDSNNYTEDRKNKELGKYGWIKFDQIAWYRGTSRSYTKANDNKPYPALAFFHIPLPEYDIVAGLDNTVGVKFENVASPKINSGMYNAILESKDIMGTFVGHDHVNDYIGTLNNICLAYGCKTGMDSYGDLDKGARVIVLHEGLREFESWLHTTKHNMKQYVVYPYTFIR